jgi:cytochrome c556
MKMTDLSLAVLLVALPALHLVSFASSAAAATSDEIISDRRANYKRIQDIADEIKKGVEAGSAPAGFAAVTQELDERARRIPGLFPAGTETGGGTHARPEIWTNRPGFDAAAAKLASETQKLAALAASGDPAAFADQFKATGAACSACHRNFRAR